MKLDDVFFLNETEIENIRLSRSRTFHLKTNIEDFTKFRQTPEKSWPKSWKVTHYKSYIRLPALELPIPKREKWDLQELLMRRKSTRRFSGKALSMDQVSTLLYFA